LERAEGADQGLPRVELHCRTVRAKQRCTAITEVFDLIVRIGKRRAAARIAAERFEGERPRWRTSQ